MAKTQNTRLLSIGHLGMQYVRPGTSAGRAVHEVFGFKDSFYGDNKVMPKKTQIRRIAKTYLGTKVYNITDFNNGGGVLLEIDRGVSIEARYAFLGAFRSICPW